MIEIPDLVSVLFIFIAIVVSFIITKKSITSYRETENKQTLIFAFAALFVGLAMIFLIVEKVFAAIAYDEFLGILFGGIATVLSGAAVASIDAFSFKMVFPKKAKIMAALSIFIISIYLAFWIWDPTKIIIDPNVDPSIGGEILFGSLFGLPFQFTPTLSYFTLFPLLLLPVLVFFYYALKIRKQYPVSSKRAWGLGLGVLALSIAYIIELLGVDPLITAVVRILFPIASVVLYWALFKVKAKEE
ncbi:MAG: hypothetical protein EU536_03195 [Promethearchaeota archaeon]|nr:MAG: hypothetical protein EU536_03195 [Candidatus Lokiarchaeota archaeon]